METLVFCWISGCLGFLVFSECNTQFEKPWSFAKLRECIPCSSAIGPNRSARIFPLPREVSTQEAFCAYLIHTLGHHLLPGAFCIAW